jgi:hypothetical protein
MSRVAPDDLQAALLVWLRRCPKRIWRGFEEYEAARKEKREDPDNKPDPQRRLSEYLAARFEQVGWAVEMPDRGNIFGDTASPGTGTPSVEVDDD